ncbi:hypothetical protein IFM12275_07910 [Nocardia sputorum]|nr:hypothetical protein IFM12275_07910 [Nocardia sputorum]
MVGLLNIGASRARARGLPATTSVRPLRTNAADVATAWAIAKGTTPIIGVTKAGYIDGLVRARGIEFAHEEIAELEALADAADVDTRGSWEKTCSSRRRDRRRN